MLKTLFRYWLTRYRRWQYLRTPRAVFVPTVTPIHRTWTDTDERLERELYLANPHAVWLRPDRNAHKVPCWQIEGFWEAPVWQYGDMIQVNEPSQCAGYHNAAAQAQASYMNGLAQYQQGLFQQGGPRISNGYFYQNHSGSGNNCMNFAGIVLK
jgi:hypothetical protein